MTREEAILWLNEEIRTWENECQSKHPIKEALYAARKALEQEPCEDAVSRASVFEIMGNLLSIPYDFDRSITEKDVSESMDKVRELPRVTPQKPRWIPVTEDLPEEGTFVLASYNSDEGADVVMTYYNKYGFTRGLMTAWMPLPQPYKAESEET